MGGLEDQLRALEDPAPASEGALASEGAVATEPAKRKLPFRGDLTLHAKKYKGRRVSRGEADLEPQDFGVTSDFEVEDVEGAGSSGESEESEDEGSMSEAERSGEEGEEFERPALVLREDELKEEEAAVAKRLADAEAKEERRAVAVREQKAIYDAVVDWRIRLEPLAAVARTFPSTEERILAEDWQSKSSEIQSALSSTRDALSSLAIKIAAAVKTCCPDEMDDELSDEAFTTWRDSVLDRWGRKVNEATGVAPKGGFKALDTTVSAQMRATLSTGKHLERSRRVRDKIELLGGAGEVTAGSSDMQYDDGELYSTLLREIIESGDGAGGSLRYAQLSKSGKVKKKTDRSASKGRRLRYTVHDKLVGFLAPVPLPDPGPLDEIVAGLFGNHRKLGVSVE